MGEVGLIYEPRPEVAAIMYQRLPEQVRNSVIWADTPSLAISILNNDSSRLSFVSLGAITDDTTLVHEKSPDSHMEVVRFLQKADKTHYKDCVFYLHCHDKRSLMIMKDRLKDYNPKVKPFGL